MIIPAQLHHLNDIIFIEKSAFNQPWTKNQFMNDIQSELDSENWVYVINELVAGYIFGWIIQGEFHLNNIAVHPEYLRRSIGESHSAYYCKSNSPQCWGYFIRSERRKYSSPEMLSIPGF